MVVEENTDMSTEMIYPGAFAYPLVQVIADAAGRYTAQVVGLHELQASAITRAEALERVRDLLAQRLASGQLVALPIAAPTPPKAPGWAKDDPLEQEFLEDLAGRREEDLEQTLRNYEQEDQGCSDTSSTPTT
jgi:hypothetical protein